MGEDPLMSAIDVILRRLGEAGVPAPVVPKQHKPSEIAFVDVDACVACGLCAPLCPAGCIQTLADETVEGRHPQPVQVRYNECVGCHICVEVCTFLADVRAIRAYDANLIEQVLGTEVTDRPGPAPEEPEGWEEYWSQGGGFHHMGEGSRIEERLDDDDRATLARERRPGL